MSCGNETFYRLDASDTIIEVGGAWDAFARGNAGGHLVAGRVEGQSLMAHVTGPETRFFVHTMLDGVRRLQRPKTTTYRCDTSYVKRYMEMTIAPEVGGQLRVAHRLVRTEALRAPVFVMQVPATHRAAVTRCSSCNRLSHDGRIWCEPDDDIAAGEQVGVVHVVCRDCYRAHLSKRHGDVIYRSHRAIILSQASTTMRILDTYRSQATVSWSDDPLERMPRGRAGSAKRGD